MEADLWQKISSIGTWFGVGLAFLGVTTAALISHGRFGKRLEDVEKDAARALSIAETHERECGAYKMEVAEKYATTKMLERLEERIFDVFRQVGDRIDNGLTRLGDRIDKAFDVRSHNGDH